MCSNGAATNESKLFQNCPLDETKQSSFQFRFLLFNSGEEKKRKENTRMHRDTYEKLRIESFLARSFLLL